MEEGIKVDEEKVEVDKLIAEGQDLVNKLLDEWNEKIKLYTKYTGEADTANIDLLDGMYRWTQVGAQWKQLALYFLGFRDSLKAVEKATDEVTVAEETMAKATGKVYNKWYELARLWAVRPDLQEYFKNINREIEKTPELGPWEEFFDSIKDRYNDTFGAIQSGILNILSTSETALSVAFYNILSGTKSFGESIKGLFESIVNAVIKELARLAAFYVFKWIFKIPGFKAGGEAFAGLGVGAKAIKGFQFGGAADTIPARLTIGEYVIAKPMTDFIKRFRAFPTNLIDAIAGGLPTPVPAFAGGGLVGNPNITTRGLEETKIYIDIHDNRIASDIDIKGLAMTIGEEVLRKIEMRRRY